MYDDIYCSGTSGVSKVYVILLSPFPGKKRLKDLLLQNDNRFCADCAAPDPKWA